MYRFHFFLSSNTKLSFSLYYTLIYPYLTYCTTVWSSTYVTNLNCIFLQKWAVQAMTNSNHLAPSAPLFAQLNILDIFEVNFLYLAQFVFKNHHRLLPSPFLNVFQTSGQIHNYDTRTSAHFRPDTCLSDIKQFTNSFTGQKYGMLRHYLSRLPLVLYPFSKESFLISWHLLYEMSDSFMSLQSCHRMLTNKSQYNVLASLTVLIYLWLDLSV